MLSDLNPFPGVATPKSFLRGRYKVSNVLGRGANGTVFRVLDQDLDGEPIALKVIHRHLLNNETLLSRFRDQILLARQLSHSNIVQLFDFDQEQDGPLCIAMELVEGKSLKTLLAESGQKPLPFEEVLRILRDVAAGLAMAHSKNIVHRDLKPSNILISFEGELKLADFGLAKSLESDLGLTRTGEILGSPEYMAPEQLQGGVNAASCDVYSFGILAYELATGSPPYVGTNFLSIADSHVQSEVPPFPDGGPPLPMWFREFTLKCIQKSPTARYSSAAEIEQMLIEHLPAAQADGSGTGAKSYSFLRHSPFQRQRKRVRLVAIALISLLLVLFSLGLAQTNSRRAIGTLLLRAEHVTGVDLSALKQLCRITVSLSRPDDILLLLHDVEQSKFNLLPFIEAGGNIRLTDKQGNSLLHYAVHDQYADAINLLVDRGVPLEAVNEQGETPLLRAVRFHNHPATTILLGRGANPNSCDLTLSCPIHIASLEYDPVLLHHLLEYRADVEILNAEGRNVVHEAARLQDFTLLSDLLQVGQTTALRADSRDREGRTPLMHVAVRDLGATKVQRSILTLLEAGASIQARDHQGKTALIHALQNRHRDAAEFLLLKGAEPLAKDAAGKSAGEYACEVKLQSLSTSWSCP